MTIEAIITSVIFVAVFAFILSEKIDRMVVSICGATAMIVVGNIRGFYSYEQALSMIELDTIILLLGMMTLISMLEKTGAFEYMAIKIAQLSKGRPVMLFLMLVTTTAFISMFLYNVTTVVLIAPVTIAITKLLKLSCVPYLIGEAILSNIGGLATIVGDPPNLIIGSSVQDLSFISFMLHLGPFALIVFLLTAFLFIKIFKKDFDKEPSEIKVMMSMKPEDSITDREGAKKLIYVFSIIIFGFFIAEYIHIRPSLIAITGAAIGFIFTKYNIEETISRVDVSILIFFSGLFITVGGLKYSGVLDLMATSLTGLAKHDMLLCCIVTIWVAAFASAILDNIPFTIAMIPMIQSLGQHLGDMNAITPLWWALALGVGLGGNGSVIGATANVIVVKLSEKTDTPITSKIWSKSGLITTMISLVLTSVLFWVFYNFMCTK